MSGGSYNYLYNAEADELRQQQKALCKMAARLREMGHASAATNTDGLLAKAAMLDEFARGIDTEILSLRSVWRAVEWLDSGDSGEERVRKAIDAYNARLDEVIK